MSKVELVAKAISEKVSICRDELAPVSNLKRQEFVPRAEMLETDKTTNKVRISKMFFSSMSSVLYKDSSTSPSESEKAT